MEKTKGCMNGSHCGCGVRRQSSRFPENWEVCHGLFGQNKVGIMSRLEFPTDFKGFQGTSINLLGIPLLQRTLFAWRAVQTGMTS
jgi:hypothetical protein